MKSHILEIIEDLLATILNFFFWLSLIVFVEELISYESPVFYKILVLFVALSLYFVRRYLNKFIFNTLAHIVILLGSLFLLNIPVENRVLFTLVLVTVVIKSFAEKQKKEEPGENVISPIAVCLTMIGELVVLRAANFKGLSPLLSKMALIYIGIYLIYMYLKRLLWFDFINKKVVKDVPIKESLKTAGPMVAGLSVFYVFTALLCMNQNFIDGVSVFLGNLIRSFFRWLFSLLTFTAPVESYEEETHNEIVQIGEGFGELFPEEAPSQIAVFLETVMIYAAVILIISVVLFGIIYGIHYLYSHFKKANLQNEIVIDSDVTEIREKIKNVKIRNSRDKIFFLSNSEKIRKYYYKAATATKTDKNPKLFTAREFAKTFDNDGYEDAYKLSLLYEKARYSEDTCTKEDVKLAKSYLSALVNIG